MMWMTEKRFTIEIWQEGSLFYKDDKEDFSTHNSTSYVTNLVENKLNKLSDENEQLKERVKDWHQRTFKAHEYFNILEKVIDEVCNDDISNQIWKEYEKMEKLIE